MAHLVAKNFCTTESPSVFHSWHMRWYDTHRRRRWIKISLLRKIGVGDCGMGWTCSRTSLKTSMSSLLDLKGIFMPSLIQSSSLIGFVNILVYITYYDQYDPSIIYLIFQLPALTHFLEAACAKVSWQRLLDHHLLVKHRWEDELSFIYT